MQRIITFCLAVVATALLWAFIVTPTAHAADPATWKGDVILFDGHAYQAANSTLDPSHGLPSGTTIYLYSSPSSGTTGGAASTTAYFIYFTAGTDPPTATSAESASFTYSNGKFSNKQNVQTIEITPKGDESSYSSCEVSGGLGWIICPVTVFLANSMDSLFGVLADMIAVRPLSVTDTGSDNGIYTAWNIMRNIANVAFVLAFLLLIYAQMTNTGLSKYGMKKMIPRLVVAAILVNLSFFVAALAIDISNVLGFTMQHVLGALRQNIFYMSNDTVGLGSASTSAGDVIFNSGWTNVATGILGAGGAVAGGAFAYSNGSLYLLFPLLLTLVGIIFLVVVVLAARQAILIILVIIAPLAFVANLLPNTEKWFNKWRDLFMTMLIFFPAFSLVFGGAQLAGQIIIQNAGTNLIMVLFGMAVQVAPLVITPLLIKLSGSLLGKIAQIVNNPNKGLIDRNRKWAQAHQQRVRDTNIGRKLLDSNRQRRSYDPRRLGDAMVRSSNLRSRLLKNKVENAAALADNTYHADPKYSKIHVEAAEFGLDKEAIDNNNNRKVENLKVQADSGMYRRAIRAETSKENLKAAQNATATHMNNQRITPMAPLYDSTKELETSQTLLDKSEDDKSAHILRLRTDTRTSLGLATINARASKEHLEAAQQNLERHFDVQRSTPGSVLNVSSRALESHKTAAEGAKLATKIYFDTERADNTTALHKTTMRTEKIKMGSIEAETALAKTIESYKTGDTTNIPAGELTSIANSMTTHNQNISGLKRGVQSYQNMQTKNISEVITSDTPRAEQLLDMAQGNDPQGRTRAKADATAKLSTILSEAHKNNKVLLDAEADVKGIRTIDLAEQLFAQQEGAATPADAVDSGLLKAALETMIEEGRIDMIRKARGNTTRFDETMMNALISSNNGALKSKGGFDLATNYKLSGESEDALKVSEAFMLGGTSPESIAGLPYGILTNYANPDYMERIFNSVDTAPELADPTGARANPKDRAFYQDMLKQYFAAVTQTLRDPTILAKIGPGKVAKLVQTHRMLQARFPDETGLAVNYADIQNVQNPPTEVRIV